MVRRDATLADENFSIQRISTAGSIILGRETDSQREVSVDGRALVSFLDHLDEIRTDMKVVAEAPQGDDDFQMGETVTGMDEIGALLVGTSTGTANSLYHNHSTGVSFLSRGTARFVSVSSFDIQNAMQKGKVVGWIHSQPGNTEPSTGTHSDAADVNVSRFLAQQCKIPSHLALITNRDGSGLTAYIYDDAVAEPEKRFRKLPGIKINTPADLPPQQRSRLHQLQYI